MDSEHGNQAPEDTEDVLERITNRVENRSKENLAMENGYNQPIVVEKNGSDDFLKYALVGGGFGFGRGGYGGGMGYGGYGGGGGGYGSALDIARREADQVRDTAQQTRSIGNEFLQQNLAKGQSDGALANALGQKDILGTISEESARNNAALAACCCETQKEILRQTQQIQMGFAQQDRTTCDQSAKTRELVHAEAEATRALINSNTLIETRDKLADAQRQLEAAKLPGATLDAFRSGGCCPTSGCDNGHGRSSSGVEVVVQQLANQVAHLTGKVDGGFNPGPNKG